MPLRVDAVLSGEDGSGAFGALGGADYDDIPDLTGLGDEIEMLKDDDLITKVLQQGVDIRECTRQVEAEMREIETDSVEDYMKESNNLKGLHEEISKCDAALKEMEDLLKDPLKEMEDLLKQMEHLQEQSLSMKIKLRNRKACESELRKFIDVVALPPDLITHICESEVNETYLEYLLAVNKKMECLKDEATRSTHAFQDVEPELAKLRNKAVARVRDFLLNKVESLKRKGTNIQILQTNVLLKVRYLNTFLANHAPDVAVEVRAQYVDTMGKYYHSKFKAYVSNLVKLQYEVATKSDLVGEPESQMRSLFSTKTALQNRTSVFSLGEREAVLEEVGKDSLIPHIAAEKKQKFTYEFLFRSILHLLCESATTEYLFTHQFFGRMDSIFHQIFSKTMALFLDQLAAFLTTSYDGVGLLLMVRLTREHQLIMSRRRVPILDSIFDKLHMELWPRFKHVFDLNLQSVRTSKGLTATDTHPHYVTRKYAELAAAIHKLSVGIDNEMHVVNMASFLSEMEGLLTTLAKDLATPQERTIFMINNYDVILSILKERGIECADTQRLEELLGASTTAFVEEELGNFFGKLIGFVKDVEQEMKSGDASAAAKKYSQSSAHELVRSFAGTWQLGIEKINGSVMKHFSNFKNGMEILKHVLTQLLLYYTRFIDIVKKLYGPNAFQADLVTIPSIMHEIKKYSRSFT